MACGNISDLARAAAAAVSWAHASHRHKIVLQRDFHLYNRESHALQVILAMPDRQESATFLATVTHSGFRWRRLRHLHKPELLTPVSIYQLVQAPLPTPPPAKVRIGFSIQAQSG